jgi:hypothetical protein
MSAPSSSVSASSVSDSVGAPSGESWSEGRIRRLVAEFERSLRESLPKKNEPKTLEQI